MSMYTLKSIINDYKSGKLIRLRGGGLQDNRPPRNNQDNTGNNTDVIENAGDLLISNRNGTITNLPIGLEDEQLTVSNGQAVWTTSRGQEMKIGYWSYPGQTAWNFPYGENGVPFLQGNLSKYNHSHKIYAELLTVDTGGVVIKTTGTAGGNVSNNVLIYKTTCQELFTTVSCANYSDMNDIVSNGTTGASAISTIVDYCVDNDLQGVDINFEAFGSWTSGFITSFNTWLGSLKSSLMGITLNLDLPYIGNSTIASSYNFDYSTFINSVDTITVMCYDMAFDFGYGLGHCPIEALVGGSFDDKGQTDDPADEQGTTNFYNAGVLGKYASDNSNNHMDKLVIGLPSYGYAHDNTAGVYTLENNLTRNKINYNSTYATKTLVSGRDNSGDLRWFPTGYTMVYSDAYSMRRRAEVCRQWLKKWELDNPQKTKPIYECIFWHMGGGNDSFYQ
jgi:hypothetical protein